MIHFTLPRVWGLARVVLVMLAGLGLLPQAAWASHLRAGDIQAKVDTTANPNPRRVFFKMVLYTDNASSVKQPTATIFFGDGTSSCKDGIPRLGGERPIPGSPDTSLNIYLFEHTFPSAGSYTVSFIGENRNRGVLNMDQSDNQSFYISTRITLDPALGLNHSPVLTAPAVDKAGVSQVYLHNPAAYDADGDSLAFHLRSSQWVPAGIDGTVGGAPCAGSGAGTGNNQPAPQTTVNFHYPNDPIITGSSNPPVQVFYNGVPPGVIGAPAIFVQDVNTGQITWNAPVKPGFYNVAMVIEEWRRTPLGRRLIGEVIRDMQIIVSATNNIRPTLTIPADICVIAGQPVTGQVSAIDGEAPGSTAPTPISLFAYSGIIPPATFRQTASGPPVAQGTFSWQTDCSNVARLPYLVVFKAQDTPTPSPTNPPLIDEKTWRITVIGPAPQNLRATPTVGTGTNPNSVRLDWNTYQCANASRIYIYRKINPSSFQPGPCETGIPPSAGYTLVGSVPANATTFTDNNTSSNGTVLGLDRGQTYCYRIYAEFPLPAGGASIASQEACTSFPGAASRLVKVDVENTGVTTGQIQVCWTKPRQAPGTTLDGTPSYVLSRGEGQAPTTFTTVATITTLADTCFTDTGINTQDKQFTYKLEFVRTFPPSDNRAPIREAAPTASSVRTTAVPANVAATGVTVSWTYNVPWDNTAKPAAIYRRTGNTGGFTRISTAPTTATGGTYQDNDPALRKGETYCYYVQTEGQYPGVSYLSSLLNRSQIQCLVLTSPPCKPVLSLRATNCDSLAGLAEFPTLTQRYSNRLSWRLSALPAGCDATIASYRLYYRPTPTGPFTLLATTAQTSYTHADLEFSGGCYAVQAVAPGGLVSDTSNVACQDNCVFFKLPNIFTPNGDNQNAVFRPKNYSPIRRIHFQAFNRWGVKVFENTTTAADRVLINWDGGGPVSEAGGGTAPMVSDGIYYYLAEVEFADFANTKRTYKGWVEVVR
ncbi:gliding motility-associated C-terminal domain-containing protein [Hymenobacter sedentarius]|uniref:T9SS type B sorting domain-containing protein n=1 Tax=Hymenobacter sedentarius TaxID=1411621 RepID=UPI000A4EBFBB|nr:gliding motility-associated C-terminal domain-containing protein [Hymenobacter sedentarius]